MRRRMAVALIVLPVLYAAAAYVLAPLAWDFIDRSSPVPDTSPRLTETADHRPGDPLNVMLIADEARLTAAMLAAGWTAADPLGVRSALDIAADIMLDRPYAAAPVSRLYLFGRAEDLAFEKPAGPDPKTRHHVRLWRLAETAGEGAPRFIGAVSFDKGIGFSRETGQLTHHISAEVDRERDGLRNDLERTGLVTRSVLEPGFHPVLSGRNGGGDSWVTDGALWIGTLAATP
ncbi:LssY C-terminal domain-containing protein [Hoeflea olei]|uniref:LssY-like C-terminal domain-containing protein n=1 Tax=Hoeflea olei TaxID=1480615 RepID=A0A1C1YYS5_9HYPH|nr:LssY C-terminal domain-containing protein [Hoeflea olei]OCW58625.1 hypothetical protein AWJ14_05660 [Hoeflea olei]